MFHIAERHPGLLPDDASARARAITWMFAALSTVEPPIVDREVAWYMEGDKPWYEQRLPLVQDRIRARLGELSARLGDADWLDGAFSAGDLMMVHGAAQIERIGYTGRVSEPLRLCCPWRSAAGIQACFRRSVIGFQRRIDRLTNPLWPGRSGHVSFSSTVDPDPRNRATDRCRDWAVSGLQMMPCFLKSACSSPDTQPKYFRLPVQLLDEDSEHQNLSPRPVDPCRT